jgi:ATP-dependent protease ClpP protease subunit
MPTWGKILEIATKQNAYDILRKQYVNKLTRYTGRNVIVYYSGWLQKNGKSGDFSISDEDKNAFMACMYKAKERNRGLDLILQTPGGDVGATESLIDYLHSMYGQDIRAIVPQIAMSGGTLLALSAKEIIMGAQSSLGPVDPQVNGIAAQAILSEFDQACKEIKEDPSKSFVWQPIISKLQPGYLTFFRRGSEWSKEILRNNLENNMFKEDKKNFNEIYEKIETLFVDSEKSKAHNRHINREKARSTGLKIVDLEKDQQLQDLVLSLHHLLCITFQHTTAAKIVTSGANGGSSHITPVRS